MHIPISLATEGLDDEAIARKICASMSVPIAYSYPAGGKSRLDPKIPGYNQAALHSPWLVLRDLDNDSPCPSGLCDTLVADKSPMLLLRIPIRTIESWLIADPVSLAPFLAISRSIIPAMPDELVSPKTTLVNRNRSRGVAAGVVEACRLTDRRRRAVGLMQSGITAGDGLCSGRDS